MDDHRLTKIARVEIILGYTFNDKYIIWEALQVRGSGVTRSGSRAITDGSKRLAIVGDRLLALHMAEDWYASGDTKSEYSQAEQRTTTNKVLAEIGRASGLFPCLNLGDRNDVYDSDVVVATLVEALVGAVWLDSNEDFQKVRNLLRRLGIRYKPQLILSEPATLKEPPLPIWSVRHLLRRLGIL